MVLPNPSRATDLSGANGDTENVQLTTSKIGNHIRLSHVRMVITCSKGMDQPGKAANSARGQLNRENIFCPVPVRA